MDMFVTKQLQEAMNTLNYFRLHADAAKFDEIFGADGNYQGPYWWKRFLAHHCDVIALFALMRKDEKLKLATAIVMMAPRKTSSG